MPHITIEFADEPEIAAKIPELMNAISSIAEQSEIVNFPGLKLRAIPLQHYMVAGAREPFVHILISMMAGPNERQRSLLSDQIFAAAADIMSFVKQVTLDFRSADPTTYRKR